MNCTRLHRTSQQTFALMSALKLLHQLWGAAEAFSLVFALPVVRVGWFRAGTRVVHNKTAFLPQDSSRQHMTLGTQLGKSTKAEWAQRSQTARFCLPAASNSDPMKITSEPQTANWCVCVSALQLPSIEAIIISMTISL
eukprot:6353945-Amphidinium_carterae.1